jgi:hypothetical protein
MSRAFNLVILLSCTGCAPLANETTSIGDEYSFAAKSWQGSYIEEMIAAWPNPNMYCGSNTIGEAGCAWWRHNRTPGPSGNPTYDYRCEAIARYDEAGVIFRIEVRQSINCHRRFKDRFDRMTRPAGAIVSATIEEL